MDVSGHHRDQQSCGSAHQSCETSCTTRIAKTGTSLLGAVQKGYHSMQWFDHILVMTLLLLVLRLTQQHLHTQRPSTGGTNCCVWRRKETNQVTSEETAQPRNTQAPDEKNGSQTHRNGTQLDLVSTIQMCLRLVGLSSQLIAHPGARGSESSCPPQPRTSLHDSQTKYTIFASIHQSWSRQELCSRGFSRPGGRKRRERRPRRVCVAVFLRR